MKRRPELIVLVLLFVAVPFAAPAQESDSLDAQIDQKEKSLQKDIEEKEARMKDAMGQPDAEVKKDVAEEEKDAGPKRWWHLMASYQFMHNLALERKTAVNSFGVSPSFDLPWELKLAFNVGFSVTTEYDRTTSTVQESGYNYEDPVGLKTFNTVDMDPISVSLSRKIWGTKFNEWSGISFGASLSALLPFVSQYGGLNDEWYFAYKPGVSVNLQLGDFAISNGLSFTHNIHGHDFAKRQDTSVYPISGNSGDEVGVDYQANKQFNLGDTTTISWSKWGVSAMVMFGVSRQWKYTYDLDTLYEAEDALDTDEWPRVSLSYGAEVGYSFSEIDVPVLKNFALAVGITTAGPERMYNFGSDTLYPFKPLFTNAYLQLSATY